MQNENSLAKTMVTSPNYFGNQDSKTTNGHPTSTGAIKRLSIIIPAYNEENSIALILDRINEVKLIRNIEREVIIVNDCSTAKTEAVIQSYISNAPNLKISYFKYLKHDVNQGKGAAIHTGILRQPANTCWFRMLT